jgi:TetR/AcrR family transcriptional repressor of nem operon
LQAAFKEMHRAGFRSADLDAILARADVTKGALYYHFDNKEALGYAVVDEVITTMMREKWVQPLQNANNPIDTLVDIVQSTSLKLEDLQCGCPLNNLSQRCHPLVRVSAEGRQRFLGSGTMQSRLHCGEDRNVGSCGVM